MNQKNIIGERIRRIRKENKITLKQLGTLINLSEQAVGQYERGERNPSWDTLKKIAAALNVPFIDLITTEDGLVDSDTFSEAKNNGISDRSMFLDNSTVKELNLHDLIIDNIDNILANTYTQEKYNYKYKELTCKEYSDIVTFIEDMIDYKLSKLQK